VPLAAAGFPRVGCLRVPGFGLVLLVIATLSAAVGVILGIRHPAPRAVRAAQYVAAAASLAALAVLAALVANADPNVRYAVEHHAPANAGMGYRISAVWAGQAGGLLLWCVETALVALGVSAVRQARALAILMGIQASLLALVVLNNPFAAPPAGFEGGLNPMLMAPMMLIHPPLLFLGYALLAVPFAVTLGGLWGGDPKTWALEVRPWLLLSWIALTAGNGFGAEWAYKTFGWGGYWAWDPVENTSFVPWILSAAAIHGVWLARRDGRWWTTAAALSLSGFLTVLYGSFLARSGLLAGASVHAYVEREATMICALALLLVAGTAASVIMLVRVRKSWRDHSTMRREVVPTAWGAAIMASIAAVVLIGMTLPALTKGQVAPGTSAYNAMLVPFAAAALLLLGVPRAWFHEQARTVSAYIVCGLGAASLVVLMISSLVVEDEGIPRVIQTVIAPVLALAAAGVVVSAARRLLAPGRTLAKRGSFMAHLGAGLFLLGAITAGYFTRNAQGAVQPGQATWLAGYRLNVGAITQVSPSLATAELDVNGRKGKVQIESTDQFNTDLRRPWISREIWGDLYVTPLAISATPARAEGKTYQNGVVLVEFHVKPGMPLVWLGIVLMAAGLCAALARRAFEARTGVSDDPGSHRRSHADA
jgi:cytochrome c-type biogenesis protein CcmF